MRALLDVNVLLALSDASHMHHARAHAWWADQEDREWASCPLTQNGFVRVMAQRSYVGHRTVAEALVLLSLQLRRPNHQFWPDALSIADESLFDRGHILGHRQLTDIYLLALAVKNGGRLATFDRAIPLAAVRGARPDHLAAV